MNTKKEKCNNSNNSSNIQLFYYEGLSVRTLNIDGEIWFVAKDVADILGFRDASSATQHLDDDEKALFNTRNNKVLAISTPSDCVSNSWDTSNRSMLKNTDTRPTSYSGVEIIIISEPGLYELVFRSNKPDAKAFSRWVRHDVLPSIRKTGSFFIQQGQQKDKMLEDSKELLMQQKLIEKRFSFWKNIKSSFKHIRDEVFIYPTCSPEWLSECSGDEKDINVLRAILRSADELINCKIQSIQDRADIIRMLSDE